MKKALIAFLVGVVSAAAFAQDSTDTPAAKDPIATGMAGSKVSAADKQKAEELAKLLATQTMSALKNSPKAVDYQKQAATLARRADDIADATMAQERKSVLKFLGLNPEGNSSLYYFVSWSMPVEVLRSYVVEAMWSGGTLVFRGIPPGMDLKSYVTKYAGELVYGKGASAAISLDPRMFDAYDVKVVPTIVYSEERRNFECYGINQRTITVDKKEIPFFSCPPVDPNKYWKISGAVTSDYALRQMVGAGAKGAQPYLDALAKGFGSGETAPKLQQGFTGEWKAAISPSDLKAVQEAAEAFKLKQSSNNSSATPSAK